MIEKQASFTGAEQRAGVSILPFIVHGLFGLGPRRRQARQPAPSPQDRPQRSKGPSRASRAAPVGNEDLNKGDALFHIDDEDEDDLLPANFTFDWAAYRAHFGDTPMEDAVTSMFAEYAVLYGRIAEWITSATPKPTTLQEARDIAHHAEDFVVKLVTPILGAVQTPKIHKLLRHTFDAINLHGNLQNANTGSSEVGHKLDKPFYRRTNKTLADFTLQIVRQAQGSRALLKRHAAKDAALESSVRVQPGGGPEAGHGCATGRGRADVPPSAANEPTASVARGAPRPRQYGGDAASAAGAAPCGGAHAAADRSPAAGDAAANSAPRVRLRRRVFRSQMTIGVLSRRPGLGRLAELLGQAATDEVRVVHAVDIAARLDCGARMRQVVRAASSFRQKPWYDAVLYDGSHDDEMLVGDVRAIVRESTQDIAVICTWEPATSPPGCPFAARSCTRLKWATPDNPDEGDWCLRAVPVRSIRRLVHVVPDFSTLPRARGVEALPAGRRAPVAQARQMRYFLNDFYPWG